MFARPLSPGAKLACPDDNDFPPLRLEQFPGPTIAGYVSIELLDPESRVAFRRGGNLAAGMTMPEAPVDEHHRPVSREDNVRLPRKVLAMKPEPEPKRMQCPAKGQFGRRVRGADPRHPL